MGIEKDRLWQLLDAARQLTASTGLYRVLTMILAKAKEILDVEGVSLLLVDHSSRELVFQIVEGKRKEIIEGIRIPFGVGIAGVVAKTEKPEIINNVHKDPRHYRGIDEQAGYSTRNLMCTPLMTDRGLIGVIEVVNKQNGNFHSEDLELFRLFGEQAAIVIEKALIHEKAMKDPKTRLYDERMYRVMLRDELIYSLQRRQCLSLAILDCESESPETQRMVANILKEVTADSDIAARLESTRYALLMPGRCAKESRRILDDLLTRIRQTCLQDKAERCHCGFAVYPQCRTTDAGMLENQAMEALYSAKTKNIQVAVPYLCEK